jgi:SEC10/PgrA surface exclusion-like protein/LPXTG-motif cell wall-anchored protein
LEKWSEKYMTKKKNIAVVGASALALGLGVTNVHAEEVTTVAPTTDQQIVSKEETKPEVKKEVTKGQVDEAKDKLDKSTKEVEQAQAKKDQAQTEKDQAQTEKDQAQTEKDQAQTEKDQAQAVKDKATPKNIEKQKQEVANAETGKADAEKKEESAKTDLDKANQVAADQEKVVKKSEDKVASAETEVKDAQTNVDNAQAILDGTGQAKVIAEKDNAEKAQAQAQTSVSNAENSLTQAKADDKKLAENISSTQTELEQAKNTVASTQTTLTNATNKASQTQANLNNAQTNFSKAESNYKAINTFQVTDDYVNALKSYVNNPYNILDDSAKWKEHREKVESILKSVNQENLNLNKFKGNANDKAISVDANNLTTEQMTELSLFASDLLNQIRERFGTPKTVVTKGMVKVADEVTDGYVADGWEYGKGHDSKAVNNVARKYGLPAYEDDTQQYLENLNSINSGDEIHTMYDAKKWVYESISDLLFNGWEWAHAQNLTGLSSAGANKEYLGVDVSSRFGRTSAHFLTVSDKQVSGNKLDKTEVPNNNTAESIVKAYNNAKSSLLNAQTENSKAQREKTSATTENIKAKENQATIEKRLNALKATPLKTPTAESNLAKAKDTLANANERLKNAKKALEALNADVKIKQQNLDKAKQELANKQTALTNAKNNLANEEAKLTELKSLIKIAEKNLALSKEKVAQATKTLEQAKTDLENLLNAEPNLAKAKNVLAQKEATLKEKATALKEAQAILDKLLQEKKIAQETYDKLFALYSAQVEAKRLADLEAQKQAILSSGETPIEVYDETGKLVAYEVMPKAAAQSPVSYNGAWTKKQDKALPNTGEVESTALGLTGLSMFFGLLGLASTKRKKAK